MTRDPAYEGFADVGVKTMGVFCRLTCPARKRKRTNTVFFSCRDAAQDAGFRPCLRCKGLDLKRPTSGALEILREKINAAPERRWSTADPKAIGCDPSTVGRAFQREYGVTFAQYARSRRLGLSVSTLQKGGSIMDAQLDAGSESGSGYREAITKLVGDAPVPTTPRPILTTQWLDTPIGAMRAIADEAGMHLLEFAERKALPGEIARAFGRPEAARAVARANGTNRGAIIVPCHRVIGADRLLTGYGGKIWREQWLLEHERRSASILSKQ